MQDGVNRRNGPRVGSICGKPFRLDAGNLGRCPLPFLPPQVPGNHSPPARFAAPMAAGHGAEPGFPAPPFPVFSGPRASPSPWPGENRAVGEPDFPILTEAALGSSALAKASRLPIPPGLEGLHPGSPLRATSCCLAACARSLAFLSSWQLFGGKGFWRDPMAFFLTIRMIHFIFVPNFNVGGMGWEV